MSTAKLTSEPPASEPDGGAQGPLRAGPSERLAILLLILFSMSLYAVTVRFDFVYDDILLLTQNPYVDSFHYLKEIFTQDFWAFQGAQPRTGYYRPLVMLTLLVEKQLWGLRPEYFHFVNVLLNSLTVVLCYKLGKMLWPKGPGAFWGALLFASLPVHTEVVSPASGLSDLECGIFMLLAVLVYVRARDLEGRKAFLAGCGVGGIFFLALLAKEVGLMLPVLLIFYEHCVAEKKAPTLRSAVARYAPLLVLAGAYLALRYEVFGALVNIRPRPDSGLKALVLSGLMLLGQYALVLVWPQHLTTYQPFRPPGSWANVSVLLGAVSLLIGAAAFVRGWRSQRRLSFALIWIFLTLGPALDIRVLATPPYGERYLFIPSVAFCWLVGEGFARLAASASVARGTRRLATAGIPALIVVLMAARTLWRLPDWKNEVSLALATLRQAPNSGPFLIRLGNVYRLQGDIAKARQMYVASLAGDVYVESYINLAGTFVDEGSLAPARVFYQRAIAADPGFAEGYYAWGVAELNLGDPETARRLFQRVVELDPVHPDALNDLGALELSQGKVEEAQQLFRRALQARPGMVTAHLNLGNALARAGQPARAEMEYRQAMRLAPSDDIPYLALASLFEQQGRLAEALEVYRTVVRIAPRSANGEFGLGVLALRMGNVGEAIQALEQASRIQPRSSLFHAELGHAYLAAGAFLQARQELEVALQLDPRNKTAQEYIREVK